MNIREAKGFPQLLPRKYLQQERLGNIRKNYTYTTTSSYSGSISGGTLNGNLFISSNGDPTLGSWRYDAYKPENFKKKLIDAIKNSGITKISGDLVIDDSYFDHQTIPGGWPWDDLGNYYGAGVWGINWRENQFDININGTDFKSFSYPLEGVQWLNDLKAGGSSDQSLIFTAPHSNVALINGMLPGGKR
jgi:D-alanyl-D-alanine carboxypeptidase/D-alanyl-D-alanine-endopeptidase (penicillin-binding protein 4)